MGNNAIDNSNLKQMNEGIGTIGFTPSVAYVYDAAAKTVAIHDNSTLIAGDAMREVKIRVHDFFGGEVRGYLVNQTGGRSYQSAPTVVFSTGTGTAHAVIDSTGRVTSVVIDTGGTGHTTGDAVSFVGGGGFGAKGTVVAAAGAVTGVTLINDNNDVTIDIASLDRSKQLAISVTYLCNSGVVADGGAYGLMAAGDIGHWDVQKNAQA